MKKYLISALGVFLLLAIVGCSQPTTPTGKAVLSFKERCTSDGNMFMVMEPTADGVPTGEAACGGCMIGGTHFCSQAEYLKALESGKDSGMGMEDMEMS